MCLFGRFDSLGGIPEKKLYADLHKKHGAG